MKRRTVGILMGMTLMTMVSGCSGKASVSEGEKGSAADTVTGTSNSISSTEKELGNVDNSDTEIISVENEDEMNEKAVSEVGQYVTVDELCALIEPVMEQAAKDLIVDGKEGMSADLLKKVSGSFADINGDVVRDGIVSLKRDGIESLTEDMLNAGIISGADTRYEKGELHYAVSVADQGHNFKSDVFHYKENSGDIIRMNVRVTVDQWADLAEAEVTGTDSVQRYMSMIYPVSFVLNQGQWKILDFEKPSDEMEKVSENFLTDEVTIDYSDISKKFAGVYLAEGEDATKEDADMLYLYAYGDSQDGNGNSLFLSQNKGDVFNYEVIAGYNNNKVIFARRNPQNEEITLEYVDKDTIIYNGTSYLRDASYDSPQ